jgi:hypothetical protein
VLLAVISRLISIMIPDVVSPLPVRVKRELIEAIANAYAALEAGATHVDTSVVCPSFIVRARTDSSSVSENETVSHPLVV